MSTKELQESQGGEVESIGSTSGIGTRTGTGIGADGINFFGADGSVLDSLSSGIEMVMDPEAMYSLDYGFAGLGNLDPSPPRPPPPGKGQGQGQGQGQGLVIKTEVGGGQEMLLSTADDWQTPSGPGGDAGGGAGAASAAGAATAAAARTVVVSQLQAAKAERAEEPTEGRIGGEGGTAKAVVAPASRNLPLPTASTGREQPPHDREGLSSSGQGRDDEDDDGDDDDDHDHDHDQDVDTDVDIDEKARHGGGRGPKAHDASRVGSVGGGGSAGGSSTARREEAKGVKRKKREGGEEDDDGDGDGDGDGGAGAGKAAPTGADDAAENPKQRANRVRNREHARNTRIRKKQYVESLKLQIEEMLQSKVREERDAQVESSKVLSERAARRQMVLNMFYLQATEELSPRSWACVLDEDFTCVCPLTPFRWFPPSEAREDHRLITGIAGMVRDTASLAVFIKSICPRSRNPTGRKLKYQFYTSPEDTVVGSDKLMCQWLMKTDNAVECGAQCEVFSHGMLRAYFSPNNRIKRLEIVFDVMGFMQQLQRAMGRGEFRMVPNKVSAAMQPSQQARLVLSTEPPYRITYTNEAWTALMGHSAEEAKMFPFTLMNGPAEANNGGALEALVQTCISPGLERSAVMDLSVMTRDMRRLTMAVQAYPLGTPEGVTTHVLLVMEELPACASLPPQGGLDLFPFV